MNQDLLNKLYEMTDQSAVILSEPMSRHTSFRIGGNADFFLSPRTKEEAVAVLRLLYQTGEPYYILGNGSNLLVSDNGYRGVVVQLYENLNRIEVKGNQIEAEAGALLAVIAREAMRSGLSGMEFASGIPGTLGGAIVMNAGAYGGEMKMIVKEVLLGDLTTGEIIKKTCEEMQFGYRDSLLKHAPYVVLGATLDLEQGEQEAIALRMEELRIQRVTKQPLEYPSAGSTFKRPEGYFAGKLIDDAGLRGYRVGGAMVSEKHCGFVVNVDHASAKDVLTLMKDVRKIVKEQSGVLLEPEVCMLGENMDL